MGNGLQRARAAAKRTQHPGTPEPAVGQRWVDCDKRGPKHVREVVIRYFDTVLEGRIAVCDVYFDGVKQSKQTTIRCSRFIPTSSGYRYVGEGDPPQSEDKS